MLIVADLARALDLRVAAGESGLAAPAWGGFISDHMSETLARARAGQVWITTQTHANVVAVAKLVGLAAVILAGGHQPEPQTLAAAGSEGLPLLLSLLESFPLACRLYDLGL